MATTTSTTKASRVGIGIGAALLTACAWSALRGDDGQRPRAASPVPERHAPHAKSVPWDEVLGPPQGTVPPPRAALAQAIEVPTLRKANAMTRIEWGNDVPSALEAANRENRPVFVTMRCLPCRACSEFDKQVLEGGPELDPLYRQFVTVRLTSAKDVDLRLMPMEQFQDMDLSWWGWLLSPQGQVYAVVGGRDQHSDATRNSKAALANTLRRVLAHHYDPRRAAWDVDGPAPSVAAGKPYTPVDLPGYPSWLKLRNNEHLVGHHGCIHCHQVAEILRQPAIDAKTFDKRRDFEVWPLPENVGLTIDRDHGLRVTKVEPGSPADRAGLKAGDEIGAAGGRRLFGQADLRGVLHRGPRDAGTVDVVALRNGKAVPATLQVADGWRRTDINWRTTVADANVGAAPGFWPNAASADRRQKLGLPNDVMAVTPFFSFKGPPTGPAADAGLKPGDVIVGVDGHTANIANRAWMVWFRLNHEPGDTVTLTVQDAPGKTREIRYTPSR